MDRESIVELEAAMAKANSSLTEALGAIDLERMIPLPRGPKGPFEANSSVAIALSAASGKAAWASCTLPSIRS